MSSKLPNRKSERPPLPRKQSEVRPAVAPERRRGDRWASDARVEILSPALHDGVAIDVSSSGLQVSFPGWLSTGTLCDLRITTHSGREIYKRAKVVWARRVGDHCVAGLQVLGSIQPPPYYDLG